MEKGLKESNNKLILETSKPIYEKVKKEVGEALTKSEIIQEERKEILKNYLVLNDALEETQENKAEVDRENLDLKCTVQLLEKEVSDLKKGLNVLFQKTFSLSQKMNDLDKEINKLKFERNESERDKDLIILGDFAYQFKNFLARIFGKKGAVIIFQVQEMIERNVSPQGIKMLERVGATDKKVLETLDKCLNAIRDARDLVGYKPMRTKMDISFEEIEKIAQRQHLFKGVSPIIKVWRALMPDGKIFDESTWKLNAFEISLIVIPAYV